MSETLAQRAEKALDSISDKIDPLLASASDREQVLQKICELLATEIPTYDWVGFYLTDPDAERELVLGPYVGEPTDHTRIPFGKGICGQAADIKETFVVNDVSEETNYLSCSPEVNAEIVVPMIKDGKVLGELDIDCHEKGVLTDKDRQVLEDICSKIVEELY